MGIPTMASMKKIIQSGVAAVTLALAGGGVAQAQTYSGRAMQADLNVAQADYNADLAGCNSRMFSGSSRNSFGRAISNGADSRACRAEAQADYLDDVARIQRRYDVDNSNTLRSAYNARSISVRLEYDAKVTECNTRFIDNLGRRGDWQDRARDGARSQQCRANAERSFYRDMSSLERRYAAQMRSR